MSFLSASTRRRRWLDGLCVWGCAVFAAALPLVQPILAAEHIEDVCQLPGSFFRPHADYLLRVKGDSMINAGIFDGDLLAVHKADDARDGQIVVARIDDEVTVKRLRRPRGRGRVTLLAENDAYAPIEVDLALQSFAIEGLSVGVIRRH